jgi:flagellar basal-body rod protein FlgF
MIKGIFSSGSGMVPRLMRLDVIANNVANADTMGFKKDDVFVQILKDAGVAQSTGKGELAGMDVKKFTDFTEGSFQPTGNPLDLAIQGEGFFAVETPDGIRYTRNGNFKISDKGEVVNSSDHPVLGTSGRISIPNPEKLQQNDLSITKNGEVYIGKNLIEKIRIVTFADIQKIKKTDGVLFTTDQTPKDVQSGDENTTVRQGFLEESNVEGLSEMVQMVELTRSFETDSRTMRLQDETLEKAMEVGRL